MTATQLKAETADQPFPSAGDFMGALIRAGFDNFETYVPYGEERPYKLVIWRIEQQPWTALVVDANNDDVTVAHGRGESVGEAIWDMSKGLSPLPWAGDYSALPGRLMLLAAVLHEQACLAEAREASEEANAAAERCKETRAVHDKALADRDALLGELSTAGW